MPFRIWEMTSDRVTRMKEDRNRDGRFDYFLSYRGNQPETGWMDINGNGVLDVRQTWESGFPVAIEFDADENGLYEFAVAYMEDVEKISWDFDEDGLVDYEENLTSALVWEGIPESLYQIMGFFGDSVR